MIKRTYESRTCVYWSPVALLEDVLSLVLDSVCLSVCLCECVHLSVRRNRKQRYYLIELGYFWGAMIDNYGAHKTLDLDFWFTSSKSSKFAPKFLMFDTGWRMLHLYSVKKVKRLKSRIALNGYSHYKATGRHMSYGITQFYLPPDTESERAPS